MLIFLFLQGCLIGFSIAVPVGPIGMLCIHHTLRRGLVAGLIAGLGAALADTLYGCLAGYGLSLVSHLVSQYQVALQMGSALFLCYLGVKIFNTEPLVVEGIPAPFSLRRIFITTFALTLTNPLTLLCFAGIYASLGIIPSEHEVMHAAFLTLGVLIGSASWWIILSLSVKLIGQKFQLITSSPIYNRVSGVIIASFGGLASFLAFQQWLLT